MLCLNYLNKTVELLFILYNFAIVPSVGTGIKAYMPVEDLLAAIIIPSVGTGIKALFCKNNQVCVLIVPFMGTGIKTYHL